MTSQDATNLNGIATEPHDSRTNGQSHDTTRIEEELLPQSLTDLEEMRSMLLDELNFLTDDANEAQKPEKNLLDIAIVSTSYGSSDEEPNGFDTKLVQTSKEQVTASLFVHEEIKSTGKLVDYKSDGSSDEEPNGVSTKPVQTSKEQVIATLVVYEEVEGSGKLVDYKSDGSSDEEPNRGGTESVQTPKEHLMASLCDHEEIKSTGKVVYYKSDGSSNGFGRESVQISIDQVKAPLSVPEEIEGSGKLVGSIVQYKNPIHSAKISPKIPEMTKMKQLRKRLSTKSVQSSHHHRKYTKKSKLKCSKKPLSLHARLQCQFCNMDKKFSCTSCKVKSGTQTLLTETHRNRRHYQQSKSTECDHNSSECSSTCSDDDVNHTSKRHKAADTSTLFVEERGVTTLERNQKTAILKLSTSEESPTSPSLCNCYGIDTESKIYNEKSEASCNDVKNVNILNTKNQHRTLQDDNTCQGSESRLVSDLRHSVLEVTNSTVNLQNILQPDSLQLLSLTTENNVLSTSTDTSTTIHTSIGEKECDIECGEPCLTKKEKKRRRAEQKCKETALMLMKEKEKEENGLNLLTQELVKVHFSQNKPMEAGSIPQTTGPSKLVFYDNEEFSESEATMNSNEKGQVQLQLCDYKSNTSASEESGLDSPTNKDVDFCQYQKDQLDSSEIDCLDAASNNQDEKQNIISLPRSILEDSKDWQMIQVETNDNQGLQNDAQKEEVVDCMERCSIESAKNASVSVTENSMDDSDVNELSSSMLCDLLLFSTGDSNKFFIGEIMGSTDTPQNQKQDEQSKTLCNTKHESELPQDSKPDAEELTNQLKLASFHVSDNERSKLNVNGGAEQQNNIPAMVHQEDNIERFEGNQDLVHLCKPVCHEEPTTCQDSETAEEPQTSGEMEHNDCSTDYTKPVTHFNHGVESTGQSSTSVLPGQEFCMPASFCYQTWMDNYIGIKSITSRLDICIHDTWLFDQQENQEILEDQLKSSRALLTWVKEVYTKDFLTLQSKRALKEKESRNQMFYEMRQAKLIYLKTGNIILKYQPVPSWLYFEKEVNHNNAEPLVFWKMPTLKEVQKLQNLKPKVIDCRDSTYNQHLMEYGSLINDLCVVKFQKDFTSEVMDQLLIYRINRERIAAKENLLSCEAELFEYLKLMCCATKAALQFLLEQEHDVKLQTNARSCLVTSDVESLVEEEMELVTSDVETSLEEEMELVTSDVETSLEEDMDHYSITQQETEDHINDTDEGIPDKVSSQYEVRQETLATFDNPGFRTGRSTHTLQDFESFPGMSTSGFQGGKKGHNSVTPVFHDLKCSDRICNATFNDLTNIEESCNFKDSRHRDNIGNITGQETCSLNMSYYLPRESTITRTTDVNFPNINVDIMQDRQKVHLGSQCASEAMISGNNNHGYLNSNNIDRNTVLSEGRGRVMFDSAGMTNRQGNRSTALQDVRNVVCESKNINLWNDTMPGVNEQNHQSCDAISSMNYNQSKHFFPGPSTVERFWKDAGNMLTELVKQRRIAHEAEAKKLRDNFYNHADAYLRGRVSDGNYKRIAEDYSTIRPNLGICGDSLKNSMTADVTGASLGGAGQSKSDVGNLSNILQFDSCNQNAVLHQQSGNTMKMYTKPSICSDPAPNLPNRALMNSELINKLETSYMSDDLVQKIKRLVHQQEQRTLGNIDRNVPANISLYHGASNIQRKDIPISHSRAESGLPGMTRNSSTMDMMMPGTRMCGVGGINDNRFVNAPVVDTPFGLHSNKIDLDPGNVSDGHRINAPRNQLLKIYNSRTRDPL